MLSHFSEKCIEIDNWSIVFIHITISKKIVSDSRYHNEKLILISIY